LLGPFASAGAVDHTLDTLQKAFLLLRTCTDNIYATRSRPCMLHQMGEVFGRCWGLSRWTNIAIWYARQSASSVAMRRWWGDWPRRWNAQRRTRSMSGRRGCANGALRALSSVRQSQSVEPDGLVEADVFAIHSDAGASAVQAFFFPRRTELGRDGVVSKGRTEHWRLTFHVRRRFKLRGLRMLSGMLVLKGSGTGVSACYTPVHTCVLQRRLSPTILAQIISLALHIQCPQVGISASAFSSESIQSRSSSLASPQWPRTGQSLEKDCSVGPTEELWQRHCLMMESARAVRSCLPHSRRHRTKRLSRSTTSIKEGTPSRHKDCQAAAHGGQRGSSTGVCQNELHVTRFVP